MKKEKKCLSLLPSDRIDNLSSSSSSRISLMDSKCHVCSVGDICPGLSSESWAPPSVSSVSFLKLSSISDMENPSLIECSGGGRSDFLVNSDFKGISLRNYKRGELLIANKVQNPFNLSECYSSLPRLNLREKQWQCLPMRNYSMRLGSTQ